MLPRMKKNSLKTLGLFLILSVFFAGCSIRPQPAELDIDTSPQSQVIIDGNESGSTPFNFKRKSGEITLRLVPQSGQPWEEKLRLNPGVRTAVRREFGSDSNQSAGEVYSLEKIRKDKASLTVVSTPDAVTVRIDDQPRGFTSLSIDEITEGEHQLILTSPGFRDRTIRAKTIKGYKLILNVTLAQDFVALPPPPGPTQEATISATPAPKTTPKPSIPTPTPTRKVSGSPTPVPPPKPYIEVSSSTGFVRVRSTPTTAEDNIITQLDNGVKVPYKGTSEDGGWYKVEYETGKTGWVSKQYTKKIE